MGRTSRSLSSDQTSLKSTDLLKNYDRLLMVYIDELKREPVNPYQNVPMLALNFVSSTIFRKRLIEMTRRLIQIPNVLKIDFTATNSILDELEKLNDQTLRCVAECNRINRRRMLNRTFMGFVPQIATYGVIVLGAAKAIKEFFGWEILTNAPERLWIALAGIVAFLVGIAVTNFLLSIQSVRLLQAFDDLIAISQARRGHVKEERE